MRVDKIFFAVKTVTVLCSPCFGIKNKTCNFYCLVVTKSIPVISGGKYISEANAFINVCWCLTPVFKFVQGNKVC